jgi:hypothetical protein
VTGCGSGTADGGPQGTTENDVYCIPVGTGCGSGTADDRPQETTKNDVLLCGKTPRGVEMRCSDLVMAGTSWKISEKNSLLSG